MKNVLLAFALASIIPSCSKSDASDSQKTGKKSEVDAISPSLDDIIWASGLKLFKIKCGSITNEPMNNVQIEVLLPNGDKVDVLASKSKGDGDYAADSVLRIALHHTSNAMTIRTELEGGSQFLEVPPEFVPMSFTWYGNEGIVGFEGSTRIAQIIPKGGAYSGKELYLEIRGNHFP